MNFHFLSTNTTIKCTIGPVWNPEPIMSKCGIVWCGFWDYGMYGADSCGLRDGLMTHLEVEAGQADRVIVFLSPLALLWNTHKHVSEGSIQQTKHTHTHTQWKWKQLLRKRGHMFTVCSQTDSYHPPDTYTLSLEYTACFSMRDSFFSYSSHCSFFQSLATPQSYGVCVRERERERLCVCMCVCVCVCMCMCEREVMFTLGVTSLGERTSL